MATKRDGAILSGLALLVVLLMFNACGVAPEPQRPQTGVHLQAKFDIPEQVGGLGAIASGDGLSGLPT
ncbi:hypothetical protein ACFLWA_08655 [Chloroflexota bacterium]